VNWIKEHVSEENLGCVGNEKLLPGFLPTDLLRVVYWKTTGEEGETLFGTVDEAVDDFLEPFFGPPRPHPDTIDLHGYARMRVGFLKGDTLDRTIEDLDEEYGDPDGNDDSPKTDKMYAAEAAYHQAIVEGYEPWACEPVVTVTIDLRKWHRWNP